jgi:hypothetical protein
MKLGSWWVNGPIAFFHWNICHIMLPEFMEDDMSHVSAIFMWNEARSL